MSLESEIISNPVYIPLYCTDKLIEGKLVTSEYLNNVFFYNIIDF